MITYDELANAKNPLPVLGEEKNKFFDSVKSCVDELIELGCLVSDEYETCDLTPLYKKFGIDVFTVSEHFLAYMLAKHMQLNLKINRVPVDASKLEEKPAL